MAGQGLVSCRGLVSDEGWAQIRTLLATGHSVSDVARLCKCSRCAVYKARDNDVQPSRRVRAQSKSKARKKIAKRQTKVRALIKKVVSIRAVKVLHARGRPRNDGRARATYEVVKRMKKLKFPSPRAVARELGAQGMVVSQSTVRRDLIAMDMKAYKRPRQCALTAEQMTRRLKFCREILTKDIDFLLRILFTDEKWFDSNDNGVQVQWVPRGKRNELISRDHVQAPPKVLVWGCIGVNFRMIKVVVYDGKGMTTEDYIEQCIVGLKRRAVRQRILMQDGARSTTLLCRSRMGAWNALRGRAVPCEMAMPLFGENETHFAFLLKGDI